MKCVSFFDIARCLTRVLVSGIEDDTEAVHQALNTRPSKFKNSTERPLLALVEDESSQNQKGDPPSTIHCVDVKGKVKEIKKVEDLKRVNKHNLVVKSIKNLDSLKEILRGL